MNLRCAFCQNPYTLSRNEILFALQKMESENLNHYDAHCPRCRRVTQIPRQRMEMAFPNWRQVVQEAANAPAAPVAPVQAAPKPSVTVEEKKTVSAPAKPAAEKTEKPAARKRSPSKVKSKPAAKKPAAPAKKTASKPKKKK